MKNKRMLAILALTISLSGMLTACGFGGDEPEMIVENTPTPEPTKKPEPTPTVVPADNQDTTYTSKDKSISIKKPDATWANKSDETDMVSFESPDQGKILILHGAGEEDMSSAVIPSTEDMANSLEKASGLEVATDFEIHNYTASNVNGVNVYDYSVKYINTEKSGGVYWAVKKVFANEGEFYSIDASVKKDDEALLNKVKDAVNSFQILGESTLKGAVTGNTGAAAGTEGTQNTDGAADGAADGTAGTAEGSTNSGGFSQEALSDTSQTRTIYRNSDGSPLVISADANGNWTDADGNSYRFANDEDVYDQNDVDYYYHGEAADVYYMPVE